jgi:hypothetical protein
MADINTTALEAVSTRSQQDMENHPALAGAEFGPPIEVLHTKRRLLNPASIEGMLGKFDPENITMHQRAQMRRDPMLALGLHFRKTTILNAPWHIECEDPQVAAFVEYALKEVYGSLLPQMMLALDYGYIPIVKRFVRVQPTWKYEDPETREMKEVWPEKSIPAVVWNTFQVIPPDGAEPKFSNNGRTFIGFSHPYLSRAKDGGRELTVPASHALWVTHEFNETFGDWYGYPLTGYACRFWWSYWQQWLLADRHMEQDADPPMKVSYPPGKSPDPSNPSRQIDNYYVALSAGTDLRDGATVAVPSDYYEVDATGSLARGAKKWDLEFVKGGENIKAFHDSFNYLDIAKLRALMVPEQAIIGAKGSMSGNVAETYGHAFAESQANLKAWIDQHINDYMIPDLVAQNFVDAPPCKIVTEGFRDEDMGLANRILEIVASNDPSALNLDYRKMVQDKNLPVLTIEEVEKRKEEAMLEQQRKLQEASANDPSAGGDLSKGRDNATRRKIADAGEAAGRPKAE